MPHVDLLPDKYIHKRLQRARAMKWLLLGVGAILLVFAYSLVVKRNLATVRRQLIPLEKQLEEKQRLAEQSSELAKQLQRAVEKQETVHELLNEPDWPHVLAEISEAAQHNAWFDELRFLKVKVQRRAPVNPLSSNKKGKEEKEEEVIEVQFTLEGHAPSNFELANFMAKLKRSPYFDDVQLNYSRLTEPKRGRPVITFEIEGTLS